MRARQILRKCCPCQCRFVPFDVEQIAQHFGFRSLPRFVRQCGGVVGFGVNLRIECRDQCRFVQPRDQRDRVRCLMERSATL
jgi:hypothetical protein